MIGSHPISERQTPLYKGALIPRRRLLGGLRNRRSGVRISQGASRKSCKRGFSDIRPKALFADRQVPQAKGLPAFHGECPDGRRTPRSRPRRAGIRTVSSPPAAAPPTGEPRGVLGSDAVGPAGRFVWHLTHAQGDGCDEVSRTRLTGAEDAVALRRSPLKVTPRRSRSPGQRHLLQTHRDARRRLEPVGAESSGRPLDLAHR
jgi:hypothetical protein